MYDFYYEALLNDDSKFNAVEGIQNTIIEVSNSEEVGTVCSVHGDSAMHQIDRPAAGRSATPVLKP